MQGIFSCPVLVMTYEADLKKKSKFAISKI